MVKRLYGVVLALLLSGALLTGCGQSATPEQGTTSGGSATSESTDRLNVTVRILPQKYWVKRV